MGADRKPRMTTASFLMQLHSPVWRCMVAGCLAIGFGFDAVPIRSAEVGNPPAHALTVAAQRDPSARLEMPRQARIESEVSGHIHPALCFTKSGTLVAVYCKSEFKPYLISRSADRGQTWTKPELFAPAAGSDVYPGSLTTLADGRLVHAWNVWFQTDQKSKSRYVAYSISVDDGRTWSPAKNLPRSREPRVPGAGGNSGHSVIRHPIVELAPDAWLLPLSDRTVVFHPETGEEAPFGDQRNHGQVPIVRTAKGTLVSGKGFRSTDNGRTWHESKAMPDVHSDGWRFEMVALQNGLVFLTQIEGPGSGGEKIHFVVSRDDGRSWEVNQAVEFYNPGRAIGGRSCPRTVELDAQTLGTIFFDTSVSQPGGSGVFFRTFPASRLAQPSQSP